MGHNFAWTLAGNVVYAGCQWGMLVALSKLGGAEMVGQFVLGLAITVPVVMFSSLQLRPLQATDAKGQYRFGDYLGLRLITLALATAVIAGVVFACRYHGQLALVILLVGLAKCVENASDLFYGLFQHQERLDLVAVSMMIKGPLSLTALGVGVYLTGDLLVGLAGLLGAWVLVLLAYDIPRGAVVARARSLGMVPPASISPEPSTPCFAKHCLATQGEAAPNLPPSTASPLRPRWDLPTLKKLAWLALPLGFVLMLISLTDNIPRYFISHVLGKRELGIFAPIAYLMIIGNQVMGALGQSASPRLAKQHAAGDWRAFRRLLAKLVGIALLVGAAGALAALTAGRPILALIYRPEYAEHTDVLVWVMIAAGARHVASMFGYAATASRRIRYQPLAVLAVIAVTVVTCHLLIGAHGLLGAAIAVATASLVGVIANAALLVSKRSDE